MKAQLSRERLENFINLPLGNGLTRSEQLDLARFALSAMDSEPVAKTQFKAVADLYEIDSGSSTPFTKSASEATKAASSGYKVQEYVKLERFQAMFSAPPSPLRESLQHQAAGNCPAVWVRLGDNNHAPDCTLDHDEAREWESRGLEVLRMVAPAPVAVPDERAAFNAWNNEDNLPVAGVGAKNAAWFAWQARAAMQAESVTAATVLDDTRRMDWLVSKTVNVREPLVYGSRDLFWSQTISDDWEEKHKTTLREQIDAAMDAEKPAAPEQEV